MNYLVENYRLGAVSRSQITVDSATKVDIRCNSRGKDVAERVIRSACPLGAEACGAQIIFDRSGTAPIQCNLPNCPPELTGDLPPDGGDREPRSPVAPVGSGSVGIEPASATV